MKFLQIIGFKLKSGLFASFLLVFEFPVLYAQEEFDKSNIIFEKVLLS